MNRIAWFRDQQGLSQEGLGRAIGISKDSVGRYERGDRDPSYRVLRIMADFLGCGIDDLMSEPPEGSENPTPPRRRETLSAAGAKAAA